MINGTLWESDGTQAGTRKVLDNTTFGITLDNFNANLTAVGDQLYFTGTNYKNGKELYVGYIPKPGVTPYLSYTDGNWNAGSTWVGGLVPTEGATVIIRHKVTNSLEVFCKELRIEEPGELKLAEGGVISVMK